MRILYRINRLAFPLQLHRHRADVIQATFSIRDGHSKRKCSVRDLRGILKISALAQRIGSKINIFSILDTREMARHCGVLGKDFIWKKAQREQGI